MGGKGSGYQLGRQRYCHKGHDKEGRSSCPTCKRDWAKINPQKSLDTPEGRRARRSSQLKIKYGVSLEEFEGMVKLQNGLCALCFLPLGTDTKNWCLDHNHETKKNRGILHRKCNVGIGLLGDDVGMLEKAVAYLRRFQ